MALPTLEKTWEFRTNIGFAGTATLEVHQRMAFNIKNVLTDTIANGYKDSSIAFVGGTTYSVSAITDDVVDVSMIGRTVKIRGSTTPGNDGDFVVTAVPDATTLEYINASGAAEAVNGSWNVLGNNWTTPWVMQHSQNKLTGDTGVRDDEVDRIGTYLDVGSVETTNYGYWVIKNTVTGTEWAWVGESSSNSLNARSMVRGTTFPNYFDEGDGGTESRPTGNSVTNVDGVRSAHREFHSSSSDWFMGDQGGEAVKLHVMMSSDGEHTRVIGCGQGTLPLFWFDETVAEPHPDWISGGNSTITSMFGTGSFSNRATYATYNDGANVVGSTLPATGISNSLDHHAPDLFISAEGYVSAAIGQNITVANELTGAFSMFPMGLVSPELGHRARLGRLKDMWWCPNGMNAGQTLPADTSRQFLVLEEIVIPWNGSLPEIS
jgi:hypothetical protein